MTSTVPNPKLINNFFILSLGNHMSDNQLFILVYNWYSIPSCRSSRFFTGLCTGDFSSWAICHSNYFVIPKFYTKKNHSLSTLNGYHNNLPVIDVFHKWKLCHGNEARMLFSRSILVSNYQTDMFLCFIFPKIAK